jgi:oxygen-dependent protoporphyrinogen oxidase
MRPRNDREVRDSGAQAPRKIVVIGAGVTGLVAAREILRRADAVRTRVEVTVLEASPRAGGKIRTEHVAGAVVETGPDSFVTLKPEMLELVRELGLESELIATAPNASVSVYKDGQLLPLPDGFQLVSPTKILPFAFSSLFTWRAKLRMALEPFVRVKRSPDDESLADFARRRLGAEALEVLVGPMLAGIFAGDAEKMSVRSTFPQLLEMEKRGGLARSLWFGGAKRKKREGFSTFMTLRGGLTRITEELVKSLPAGTLKLDCPATALRRSHGRWEVVTPQGVLEADAVIAASPAPAFADTAEGLDPELAARLREIPFVSTATIAVVYDAATMPAPPQGFGFLTSRGAKTTLTAATFATSKFPDRPAPGKVVIRAFAGGAGREESAEGPITRLEERVQEDLGRILGLSGAKAVAVKSTRWLKANPQYNVGHSRRLERLTSCLKSHPGLILAGCSYGGVGLPDCVRSGRRAAELILTTLAGRNHEHAAGGLA